MARSLSATYLAAQNALTKTPYLKLLFKRGASTVDLSSDNSTYGNRLIYLDHNEEPYNGYATVILRNKDRDIPNLKGRWLEIGYGYVTGAGKEYLGDGTNEPAPPRLWVKHQQSVSANGKLWELLELEDMWTILRETLIRVGAPPLYTLSYTTDTIYTIIGYLLAEADPPMTLEALVEDDGIINSLQPQFDINAQPFEYADALLYRLLNMTASYLKALDELRFEIKFPQDSDLIDWTFYNYQAPYFYEYMERRNCLIPNHIYVFGNAGDDGLWTNYIVGEAKSQDEIDSYVDVVKVVLAGSLTVQADVNNRAASQLARARFEQLAGRLTAPNHSGVELYDRIKVVDTRGEAEDAVVAPIPIYNVSDLQNMKNNLTATYELMNDIDASETATWNWNGSYYLGFDPIGSYPTDTMFRGKLYGNRYNISNLYIGRRSEADVGLFGRVINATVKGVNITNAEVWGVQNVGVMVGSVTNSNFYDCHVSGELRSVGVMPYESFNVGGFAGYAWYSISCCSANVNVIASGWQYKFSNIGGFIGSGSGCQDCYATGNVTLSGGGRCVGGFVGAGSGIRCYATGNVDGSGTWGRVGGFAGQGGGTNPSVNCYARGSVIGNILDPAGGFVGVSGSNNTNCYSTGSVIGGSSNGGFSGSIGGDINCFWDKESSGLVWSAGGTGLTTAQAKAKATYIAASWDFSAVWEIIEGVTYPTHIWQCYGLFFPTDSMARVSSIRRVFHPGLYRMELQLGDLGIDIDVVDLGVKKIVEGIEEPVEPTEPAVVPTPTKIFTPEDWTDVIIQQVKEGWIVPSADVPGIAPTFPIGATKTTLEKPLNIQPDVLAKLSASNASRMSNVSIFIEFTALDRKGKQRTLAENIRYNVLTQELRNRGYAL